MKQKILTIPIAAYNMQEYLPRCLDSILTPEVSEDIEVIVINDGSVDNTLLIAREYEKKFPNTIKVIDKPNAHYGSCINAGLKIASGKYFRPLDPDDWFDTKMFITFINKLRNINVDMIFTNSSYEYSTSNRSKIKVPDTITEKITPETVYNFNNYDSKIDECINQLLTLYNITYQTQLLKDMKYCQTEGISYSDTEYYCYPLEKVNSFIYLDIVLYRYYIGREGQSISQTVVINNRDHLYILISKMYNYLKSNPIQNKNIRNKQLLAIHGAVRMYYYVILVCNKYNATDEKKLKEIDKLIETEDEHFYNQLNGYRILKKIYYIKLWRTKGKYCNDTFWIISFLKISLFTKKITDKFISVF